MLIYFKNCHGTYLTVKSENIAAFKSENEEYNSSGAIDIYAVTSYGKEIINAFFYRKGVTEECKKAWTDAGKYIERISNLLLIENACFAEVFLDPENTIILSDGRSF